MKRNEDEIVDSKEDEKGGKINQDLQLLGQNGTNVDKINENENQQMDIFANGEFDGEEVNGVRQQNEQVPYFGEVNDDQNELKDTIHLDFQTIITNKKDQNGDGPVFRQSLDSMIFDKLDNTLNSNRNLQRNRNNSQVKQRKEGIKDLDTVEIMKLKLYNDQIQRTDLQFDQQCGFRQEDLEVDMQDMARPAKHNQKLYLDNFGIDIYIPTFFVIDSFLWSKNPDYIFKVVKYVLPEKRYKTIQHQFNGESNVSSYQTLYGDTLQGNLILRVLYNGKHSLENVGQIILPNLETARIAQSADGSMIATMTPEVDALNMTHNEIRVYHTKSDNPMEFLKEIEQRNWICRFEEDIKNNMDLNFVSTMQFDNQNTKLIAWGKEIFMVLNLQTLKAIFYQIQLQMFESILSLTYKTYDTFKKDQCILTCKARDRSQIIIFDYFYAGSGRDKNKNDECLLSKNELLQQQLDQKLSRNRSGSDMKRDKFARQKLKDSDWMLPFQVDYFQEYGQQFIARMSTGNDCMIFANESEVFVVDFTPDCQYKKRKLTQMKNKVIHLIKEDPCEKGFYIICSKKYDQRLELEHTHRQEIFMNFERQVEPGIIKMFDINVQKSNVMDQDSTEQVNLRVIGMRDDQFNYDQCSFLESKLKNTDQTSDQEWIYEQEILKITSHMFAQMTSFCINWPHIAFSGMDDYLVLMNLNLPDYIH